VSHIGPSKIGKYDVESRIGEGAMGVVYRARDPVLARAVAIKVMSDAFAQNDDLRERFLREAQAAGSLQHPNIITIYDFGEVDGHPYIAMEFVEGQDVAELLAQKVPLTLTHKLDLAIGLLQGLAFAHRRGIVHRDIKPANIRVDTDGNARIIDFGVVHLASSEMTRTGVMLGTPSYMAPEQIVGGKVGPETDIFSAGAVLYELLTGTRPFAGDTLQQVMYRVLSEPPRPLQELAPELPAKLNEIVMRSLAKEPGDRYANGLDMANDLNIVRASIGPSPTSTLSLRATIESALEGQRRLDDRRVRRRKIVRSATGVVAAAALLMSGWLLAGRSASARRKRADAVAATQAAASPTAPSGAPGAPAATLAGAPDGPGLATAQRSGATTHPMRTEVPERSSAIRANASLSQRPVVSDSAPTASGGAVATPSSAAALALSSSGVSPEVKTPVPPVASNSAAAPPPAPPTPLSTASRSSASSATPPPLASPSNQRPEISAVIDAYARAIESRDVAELRRSYATLTTDQARAFRDFFASTRELRATLEVQNLRVDGNSATARVSGVYEFTTNAGRADRQAVTFDVELRRDAGSWRLIAVR
jgi:eukaryotic-like serine/threonine-protein kinase